MQARLQQGGGSEDGEGVYGGGSLASSAGGGIGGAGADYTCCLSESYRPEGQW